MSASSAAATVTVWVVFQVEVLKLSDEAPRVTLLLPVLVSVTVTSAVGWVASRTVKVLVAPSVTVSVLADRVRPGVGASLSVTVTVTVAFARAL